MRIFFSILFLTCFANLAQARVFSVANESFAAYLGGTYGAGFTNTMNSMSDGAGVTLNSVVGSNQSGEFGFIYANSRFNLRFGMEVLRPPAKTVDGTDASSTPLYSLTSEVSVIIPKFDLDINLKKWETSRIFLSAGAGSASLVGRNSYTFTAAGTTNFGLADFAEDLRAETTMYEGALGFEGLFTDTTTYMISAGYRGLNFKEVRHNKDLTTFQGAVVKGDKALNDDGSQRTLNMSGYFVGIQFRFWIY